MQHRAQEEAVKLRVQEGGQWLRIGSWHLQVLEHRDEASSTRAGTAGRDPNHRTRGTSPGQNPGGETTEGRGPSWVGGSTRQGDVGTYDGGSSCQEEAGIAARSSLVGRGKRPRAGKVVGGGPPGRCSAAHASADGTSNASTRRSATISAQPISTTGFGERSF